MQQQLRIEWRTVNEDYEGCSDDSSITIKGREVVARCNGVKETYELSGDPVKDGSDFESDWALDPTFPEQVNEVCLEAFGVSLVSVLDAITRNRA